MLRTVASACLALAIGASSIQASAQEAQQTPDQLDEAARLTFESARQAFVAGEYERALNLFRQAYQLSARPGLLYNIAQTLDRLRRDAEALEAFREFLEASPDTPNRSEVEARIRVLEQAVRDNQQAAPPTDPVTGEVRPDPGIAILHPAIFITAGGLTLAAAGVLIWAGLDTMSLNDEYLATNNAADAQAAYDAAVARQDLTNAFIGVTAGLAAVSVVLAIFTDWNALTGGGERASLTPYFFAGPSGAQAGLSASF